MDQEKKIIMGKNAKIIVFSLIGIAVLAGVAVVLMLTSSSGTSSAFLLFFDFFSLFSLKKSIDKRMPIAE